MENGEPVQYEVAALLCFGHPRRAAQGRFSDPTPLPIWLCTCAVGRCSIGVARWYSDAHRKRSTDRLPMIDVSYPPPAATRHARSNSVRQFMATHLGEAALKRIEKALDQAAAAALLNATSTTPRLLEAAAQSLGALAAHSLALAPRPRARGRAAGLPREALDGAAAACRALLLDAHCSVPEIEEGFASIRAAVTAMHVNSRRLANPGAQEENPPDLAALQKRALPLLSGSARETVEALLARLAVGERLGAVAERVQALAAAMAGGAVDIGGAWWLRPCAPSSCLSRDHTFCSACPWVLSPRRLAERGIETFHALACCTLSLTPFPHPSRAFYSAPGGGGGPRADQRTVR